jgi:lycopene beta-cyclase
MAYGSRNPESSVYSHDVLLVGGGLQNGLIALACLAHRPELRIAVIERESTFGGNHTWCLHSGDVPDGAAAVIEPLITHRYDAYDVRFPGFARTVRAPYAAITSERFDQVLQAKLGEGARLGRSALQVGEERVVLDHGEELTAPLVIDARGPSATAERAGTYSHVRSTCGFQKFVGLELELAAPHALEHPILMDATVPQDDGYRFFYVLPFGPDRLLVEDTVFSRSPSLDVQAGRASVLDYAKRFGEVTRVVRTETGVLPMPWSSDMAVPERSPLIAGYQGGFFHPATGYSLPIALRLARHVAAHAPYEVFGGALSDLVHEHKEQARYAKRLNALLFHAFAPEDMWNVFARFYRLPDALIERFYALQLTPLDRARILIGKPPKGFSLTQVISQLRSPRALGAT